MCECEKHCKTIMIGSLSIFEDFFGYLWGYDKDEEEEFTEEENVMFQIWSEARSKILDMGNDQIHQYKKNERYTYNIEVRNRRRKNG